VTQAAPEVSPPVVAGYPGGLRRPKGAKIKDEQKNERDEELLPCNVETIETHTFFTLRLFADETV
jgi:hypothetical protein